MPFIRPFKALRFNDTLARSMSRLICPPYDIISEKQQKKLYKRDPYNIVRLELPQRRRGNDQYRQARQVLRQWIKEGVLKQEARDMLYVYEQRFTVMRKRYCRRGIFAAVKIEKPRYGSILPHEYTLSKHKRDRLRLLKQLKINTSPIFAFFTDHNAQLRRIINRSCTGKPLCEAHDAEGVDHRLSAIPGSADVKTVVRLMRSKRVFIADGHHRYETAWNYYRSITPSSLLKNRAAYVLMFLCPAEDHGLHVLPTHRVICNERALNMETMMKRAQKYFIITRVASRRTFLKKIYDSSRGHIGIMSGKKYLILAPKDLSTVDTIHKGRSRVYRRLPVVILHTLLLAGIDSHRIFFFKDASAACTKAARGTHTACILPHLSIEDIRRISLAGEVMPQKTTYFYPKLATGWVMYTMEDFA